MKITRRCFVVALALLTASAIGAESSSSASKKMLSSVDKQFIKNTLESMYFQTQLAGKTRRPQSEASPAAQKLGAKMYSEMNKVWGDIATVATNHGEKLVNELSPSDKNAIKKLPKMDDPKFDKEYFEMMGKEAKKLVMEFEKGAKSVQNPSLKAAAEKWTPKLKEYAAEIEAAEKEASAKK